MAHGFLASDGKSQNVPAQSASGEKGKLRKGECEAGLCQAVTLALGGRLALDRTAVALAHFLQSLLAGLAPHLRDLSILAELWRVREHPLFD